MTNENTFYLDADVRKNPNFSDKMNKVYRALMLILGSIMIFLALYHIIHEGKFWFSINLIYGLILLLFILLQPWFYKKYGRKYVRFTEVNLSLKLGYFVSVQRLKNKEIAEIKFEGEKFVISTKTDQQEKVEFKAGLEVYESLRTRFRTWAGENQIPVKE